MTLLTRQSWIFWSLIPRVESYAKQPPSVGTSAVVEFTKVRSVATGVARYPSIKAVVYFFNGHGWWHSHISEDMQNRTERFVNLRPHIIREASVASQVGQDF